MMATTTPTTHNHDQCKPTAHHHTPEPADGTPKPFASVYDMTFARVISVSPLSPLLRTDTKKIFVALAGIH